MSKVIQRLREFGSRLTNRQLLAILVFATLANIPLGLWILAEQVRGGTQARDLEDLLASSRIEKGSIGAQRVSALERRVRLMEQAAEGYEARAREVGQSLAELIERAASLSRGDAESEKRLLGLIRAAQQLEISPGLDSERLLDLRNAFEAVTTDMGATRAEISSLGHQLQTWINELRDLRRRINALELGALPVTESMSLSDRR